MRKLITCMFLLCLLSCNEKGLNQDDQKDLVKDLEKSTLESVKQEFKKKGWTYYKIKGITLIHKTENEYSGILAVKIYDSDQSIPIDVVYDGTNILWSTK